jgi:L-rhamnose mutarotase
MSVFNGKEKDYISRHNSIWPELKGALKAFGAHNYSIFYHRATNQLFAYVEVNSKEIWDCISEDEACKRWWSYMKDIMPVNPDESPVSVELREVFHLD